VVVSDELPTMEIGGGGGRFGLPIFQLMPGASVTYFKVAAIFTAAMAWDGRIGE